MNLHIRNMVSLRCKHKVCDELEKLGIPYERVELGYAEFFNDIPSEKLKILKERLAESGLELMEDKRIALSDAIKQLIRDMIRNPDEVSKFNFTSEISRKLDYDYTYLSTIFSEVNNYTIQHFIILNKIEFAKELLLYNDLSLSEVSYKLQYSSVAHLSGQFKKVTGLSPSMFKERNEYVIR